MVDAINFLQTNGEDELTSTISLVIWKQRLTKRNIQSNSKFLLKKLCNYNRQNSNQLSW